MPAPVVATSATGITTSTAITTGIVACAALISPTRPTLTFFTTRPFHPVSPFSLACHCHPVGAGHTGVVCLIGPNRASRNRLDHPGLEPGRAEPQHSGGHQAQRRIRRAGQRKSQRDQQQYRHGYRGHADDQRASGRLAAAAGGADRQHGQRANPGQQRDQDQHVVGKDLVVHGRRRPGLAEGGDRKRVGGQHPAGHHGHRRGDQAGTKTHRGRPGHHLDQAPGQHERRRELGGQLDDPERPGPEASREAEALSEQGHGDREHAYSAGDETGPWPADALAGQPASAHRGDQRACDRDQHRCRH